LYQGLCTPIPTDKSKKKHDFFQGHTVSSLDAFPLNSDASSDICQFFSCILTPRMVSLLCHVLPFMSRAYSMGGIPLSNHGQQKGSPANSDDVLPRNQLMQIGVPISDLTKKKKNFMTWILPGYPLVI
jgi:hypothetical protein